MVMRYFRMLAFALATLGAFIAMAKGGGESGAASLKGSQTVVLVNEKDEDGERTDIGAYYFKLTLKRYASYSVWINTNNLEDVSLEVYTNDEDAGADFDVDTSNDGILYARIGSEDWDVEDPSSVTFYVYVTGNVGDRVTVNSSAGYMNFEPKGSPDNIAAISFDERERRLSTLFVDDEYWMSAYMRQGRMYRVQTTGGTPDEPISFEIDGKTVSSRDEDIAEDEDDDIKDFIVIDDPRYADDTNNVAVVVSPGETKAYTFLLTGGTNANFSLTYQLLKARTPADHKPRPLDASNGFQATFVPGRQIANWDYGDLVIDDNLFSVALAKGQRCAFETSGSTTNLMIAVYDAKGNILADNTSLDGESLDVRAVLEAPSAGTYYVGVCNSDLAPYSEVTGGEVTLFMYSAATQDGDPDEWDAFDDTTEGASGLEVAPGTSESLPLSAGATHGPHRLSATDWADNFVVAARKGVVYRVGLEFADPEEASGLPLNVEVFTLSGKREVPFDSKEITPGEDAYVEFMATVHVPIYVRVSVADGAGLDYPAYNVRAVAYSQAGDALGVLTVNTPGAKSATWSLDREAVKYPAGSSVLVSGTHTVKPSAVSGYKASVASTNVTVAAGTAPTVVEIVYTDTFDPKDDAAAGATALSLKNAETDYAKRTLWQGDPGDNFSIAGTDGHYYDLALKNVEGDNVLFSITNAENGVMAENVASVRQLTLPKTKSKYILTVKNGDGATAFGGYTLSGKFANVGAIRFASQALKVKEDAAGVTFTVNRGAKDGRVRVRYGTVAGTAKPGEDYVAQSGELEWADGDNKAKKIVVNLIPDLVPVYEGDKTFSMRLEPIEAENLAVDEYPASVADGGECVVTLQETAKVGTTADDAYAKVRPKAATTKTEDVPIESGTFYGVLKEDGSVLTNGLPRLAAVTFTASAATESRPAKLSAKVAIAGKTYTFSGNGWDDGDGEKTKTLELAQRVNKFDEETGKSTAVMVTNTLVVAVAAGSTADSGAWLKAGGEVELVMNVPDANNKGHQEEVLYRGDIYRNNAKIQEYLNVATNFAGYYTAALVPDTTVGDGVPAGNGYLTLTIDGKGTAKAAGMLADGSTKPSISAAACAIVEDAESSSGYSMMVPLFLAKSPFCFGGVVRLYADAEGTVVVDSSAALLWNNDNKALTYDNENGYQIELAPVGGWYDKVINLQRHYLDRAFSIETAEADELPAELLADGYGFVYGTGPNEMEVDLAGNAFSVEKQSLTKNGRIYDLENSVNPSGLQFKFTRATGIFTGSFAIWSESADGSAQKQIGRVKANGVMMLARDPYSPIATDVAAAGFFVQQTTVVDEDPDTGKKRNRKWTFSAPFNLIGVDLGDVDWWADDWGESD